MQIGHDQDAYDQAGRAIVYASALNGYAGLEGTVRDGDMTPLYEAIMQAPRRT
ncbi:hypothetical protein [Stenotrophomonas sepilia]